MKKAKGPFREFNKMVKCKYGLDPHIFENMPNKQRNKMLEDMLESTPIVLFPTGQL